jgi:hypothetical protein
MTTGGRGDVTSPQARDLHDQARAADAEHDQISCWCCCWDCDFDVKAVWANDAAAAIESVV